MPFENQTGVLFWHRDRKGQNGRETKASKKNNGGPYEIERKAGQSHDSAPLLSKGSPITDAELRSLELEGLVVVVYFTSRGYKSDLIHEMLQKRVGVRLAPDIVEQVLEWMKQNGLFGPESRQVAS